MTGEPGGGCSLQRRAPWAPVAAALAALALAACDGAGLGDRRGSSVEAAESASLDGAPRATQLVETDVEAPEVFQVTDQGLWDGRPSLGGVWVAHPDVASPERVVIRNQDNDQLVIGALFRRERDNPGPPLQVSSDAAEALAMLAGAPATLEVTALRRAEPAEPAPAEAGDPVSGPVGDAAGGPVSVPDEAAPASADPAAAAVVRAPTALPEGAASPPGAAAVMASDLQRPVIRLGLLGVGADAQAPAQDVTTEGRPARVVASTTQGADAFRVLVGLASAEAERVASRDRVAAEGFADPSFVTGPILRDRLNPGRPP